MFIIEIKYKVDLAEIDAHMKMHVLFLSKYYKTGNFILSGRKVPRNGGIIIAQANDIKSIKKIMSEDPFVKMQLASYRITEFLASQKAKGLKDIID